MIKEVMQVMLKPNQYSSLCYLASHNDKEDHYITDINTAFSTFKDFMTRAEMMSSVERDIKYILFTKETI